MQMLCFKLAIFLIFSLFLNNRNGVSNEGWFLKRLVLFQLIILINKLKPLLLTTGVHALLTSKMHMQPAVPSGLGLRFKVLLCAPKVNSVFDSKWFEPTSHVISR